MAHSDSLVEYLLRHRYGSLAPPPPPTIGGRSVDRSAEIKRFAEIEATRAELRSLPPEKLAELAREARLKDAEAARKREQEEESALFFNQSYANADARYWIKMASWKFEEAISLSLGKNPAIVNWSALNGNGESYIPSALQRSAFRNEYGRRRELLSRAIQERDLSDPIKPKKFLKWALDNFDSIASDLMDAARARGIHPTPEGGESAWADKIARYPTELRAAIEAFEHVQTDTAVLAGRSPKNALLSWLEANRSDLSNEARQRIATVANWSRNGGAPRTPSKK